MSELLIDANALKELTAVEPVKLLFTTGTPSITINGSLLPVIEPTPLIRIS